MKPARAVIAIVVACAIAGCSTYGGARVYGAFRRVSAADLHAAFVAVRKERQVPEAYAFRVVSANEIWVYFTPDQDGDAYIATRSNGRWKFAGVHVSPKEPILFDPNPNA